MIKFSIADQVLKSVTTRDLSTCMNSLVEKYTLNPFEGDVTVHLVALTEQDEPDASLMTNIKITYQVYYGADLKAKGYFHNFRAKSFMCQNYGITETDRIKTDTTMKVEFPNGFESWRETHYEVVSWISCLFEEGNNTLSKTYALHGRTGLWDLAKELTDKFEREFPTEFWGGDEDFFEEIDKFVNENIK